jgi:peroxidase
MSRKPFLLTAIFFVVASMSFINGFAQRRIPVQRKPFIFQSRPIPGGPVNVVHLSRIHTAYRTYDGTNNNIDNNQKAGWGSADIPLYRELPPEYGPGDPKNAMGGNRRPSPRAISNAVIDEPVTTFNARGLSAFVYVWGQFLDHDMSLTPTDTTEYVPVSLPADETIFTEEIPFYRSEVRTGTGINSPRQQSNLNTAWIDGSVVYGTDSVRTRWLRTFKNGKMKTSTGNLLPFNTLTGEIADPIDLHAPDMANDNGKTVKTFVAGDVRAAEHPGIASLHTLFVREHNRICDRLISQGFKNDELIFQMARKEVGALIEAITYQEFLPAIGITLRSYKGYNNDARPDIANTFATAAYRLGHTMVADDIMLFDNECEEVGPGELDLLDAFWQPQLLLDYKIEPFLKGLAAHTQYETDTKINSVLRNFLFVSPNDPVRFGIDLGSLNIQRGRDHGLPNYNVTRRYYTGKSARNFSDITSNDTLASSLKNLYKTVDNVDVWVGILAEDHLPGKSVGNTVHEMLRVQFEKLRDGDYYFYRNDPFLPSSIRDQIKKTTFADVLRRNTSLTNLQRNVFFTEECPEAPEDSTVANALNMPVEIVDNAEVRIFPNPVADVLNIELHNAGESPTIKIFTTDGLLLKTVTTDGHQNTIQINTSHFTSGMYVVNITTGKGLKSFKFVKL